MNKVTMKFTVFFETPFWIGVFERTEDGNRSVCKVTFGTEPKEPQVAEFVLKNFANLKFSPAVEISVKKECRNPKRLQREARKQTLLTGIGTKSQQALQQQREEMKLERKTINKEKRTAEQKRKYELKQKKQKQKHKGR